MERPVKSPLSVLLSAALMDLEGFWRPWRLPLPRSTRDASSGRLSAGRRRSNRRNRACRRVPRSGDAALVPRDRMRRSRGHPVTQARYRRPTAEQPSRSLPGALALQDSQQAGRSKRGWRSGATGRQATSDVVVDPSARGGVLRSRMSPGVGSWAPRFPKSAGRGLVRVLCRIEPYETIISRDQKPSRAARSAGAGAAFDVSPIGVGTGRRQRPPGSADRMRSHSRMPSLVALGRYRLS